MLVNRGKSQIYLTLNILLRCKVIEVNIVGAEAIYFNKYSCYFFYFVKMTVSIALTVNRYRNSALNRLNNKIVFIIF